MLKSLAGFLAFMSAIYSWRLPEAPQVVSSLLLKVHSCTNHKCIAMIASTSVYSLCFRSLTLHSSCKVYTRTFKFRKMVKSMATPVVTNCHMSTGPRFPSENLQNLLFEEVTGCTLKIWSGDETSLLGKWTKIRRKNQQEQEITKLHVTTV